MELVDFIEYEHLSEHLRYVCDIVGIEKTRELISELGCLAVDIPSINQFTEAREQYIAYHHGKLSIKKLANKLGRSTKTVRRIINRLRETGQIKREEEYRNPYKVKLTRENSFRKILEDIMDYD